jgi:hypothetical protein
MINDKNNKKAPEPPEIEFFRECSERLLYWDARARNGEPDCKNFADSYKDIIHKLTSEE